MGSQVAHTIPSEEKRQLEEKRQMEVVFEVKRQETGLPGGVWQGGAAAACREDGKGQLPHGETVHVSF